MRAERLSELDAAFLAVERPTAPMHVGWVALFDPPESGPAPSAEALLDHLGARLACRATCAAAGCRLREVHPAILLAGRHALSVGVVTVARNAGFGVTADAGALPDAGAPAGDLDAALDELLSSAPARAPRPVRG